MGLLDNIFGGGQARSGTSQGMSPITMALIGLLAYRTLQGKGRLAEMLGRKDDGSSAVTEAGAKARTAQPGGGLGGLLGGLFGGSAAGGILSGA